MLEFYFAVLYSVFLIIFKDLPDGKVLGAKGLMTGRYSFSVWLSVYFIGGQAGHFVDRIYRVSILIKYFYRTIRHFNPKFNPQSIKVVSKTNINQRSYEMVFTDSPGDYNYLNHKKNNDFSHRSKTCLSQLKEQLSCLPQ